MSRIDELIERLCPDGVEYKTLGEVAAVTRGGGFQKKDFISEGFPCIHYGQIYTRFSLHADEALSFLDEETAAKSKKALPGDVVMAVTSENIEDVCKCITWLGDGEVAVSGHTAIIRHSQNPKFMTYYFRSGAFDAQKRKLAHGTKVIEVTPNKLLDIRIPVPPLEVQLEIVKVLDSFAELEAELEAELAARRKQYAYYRDKLLTFPEGGARWTTLGEVCRFINGRAYKREELLDEGRYRVLRVGNFGSNEKWYFSNLELDAEKFCESGDLLYAWAASLGAYIWEGEKAIYHYHIWKVEYSDRVVLRNYLLHYLRFDIETISSSLTNSTMPHVSMQSMKARAIALPPFSEQQRIVDILDEFDALVNDITAGIPAEIEARRKQYEYYRDKLLTFKEKVA